MATKSNTRALPQTAENGDPTVGEFLGEQQPAPEGTAPEPQSGQLASRTPATDALLEWCAIEAGDPSADSGAGLESIIRQTLEAEDMAAVFRQTLPQNGQDFVDVPMLWTGYRIMHSEFEEGGGAPYYASLSVQVGNPVEHRVINCGGWRVLAQVMMTATNGEWPQVVMIIEAAKAKKGQSPPLMLVRVDQDGKPIVG